MVGHFQLLFRNKCYSSMPDLLVNGDILSDTKQKADSLNEYFTAQTQIPNDTNSPIPLVSLSTYSPLSVAETDELEVLNLLSIIMLIFLKLAVWTISAIELSNFALLVFRNLLLAY